ncbi:MAG: MFS transporter [Rhodospirillales bacterium]|nr:MFS transporter [Rhodospirillales bacterium]
MSYLRFLKKNWRFVGFGFTMSFSASFGQTFYIALSGANIRSEFGLSHGGFGSWFALATIASAMTIIWLGRVIDRVDLRWYTLAVCIGLVLSMLMIASAPGIIILVIGLYLARLTGQGLLMHISTTSMGRYFDSDRGKAVSISAMGQSFGEAILPVFILIFIVEFGWRESWYIAAITITLLLAVLIPNLMRDYTKRHQEYLGRISLKPNYQKNIKRQWSRSEVLKDFRFYVISSVVLSFSFICTGLFFHQIHIAETKGWPLEILASAFIFFAIFKVFTSLCMGSLIDRFGSIIFLPIMQVPLIATLSAITVSDAYFIPFMYLSFMGVSIGILMPVMGSLWPELYGVMHLGSIRAAVAAMVALTSAISPAVFGLLLDQAVSIETLSLGCIIYIIASGILLIWTFRNHLVKTFE